MEQRQDYLEKQINNLGLVLNKILSNTKFLDEENSVEHFFSIVKEQIGSDLQSTVISKEILFSFENSGQINRDNIFDIVDIMLLLQNNHNTSTAVLKNILVILDYLQSTSKDYSFDIHLKIKKIKEKLTD